MKEDRARDRLALALDLPLPEAEALYRRVASSIGFAKIGLALFAEHGPAAVERFLRLGAKVFLDLKLHDIPHTVELAAAGAARLGISFLTVHGQGGSAMLRAAMAGVTEGSTRSGTTPPKVLAVTALTSLSDADLEETGFPGSAAQLASRLARLALASGVDGLVCSPQELKSLRELGGPKAFLCTPGIRPEGAERGDQSRVATPEAAIRAGANLLVIGRPIYASADPIQAAREINASVSSALVG
jgi:orotidine-5'-phosphate decarboxylase